jgi:hypothetical protein
LSASREITDAIESLALSHVLLSTFEAELDDAQAMEQWSESNEQWLSEFLDMPHGAPSQDVYWAVFGALAPKRMTGFGSSA